MYFAPRRSTEIGELAPNNVTAAITVVASTLWGAALGAIVARRGDRGRAALVAAAINGGGSLAVVLVRTAAGGGLNG